MTAGDLRAFEALMKSKRGWTRGQLCGQLGISQPKLRRALEGVDDETEIKDRTLALAVQALAWGLDPYPHGAPRELAP